MWDVTPKEAVAMQRKMAEKISEKWEGGEVQSVAGIDVCIRKGRARAAIAVLDFETLELVEAAYAEGLVGFPYVPGLLTFREGPLIMKAAEKLSRTPDLLIFDGQGIAHPRRLGIASHMGLLLETPSIGCAKTRLCGDFTEPGPEKGCMAYLRHKGETIGAVLRTRKNVKPVFVSVGHRIDLDSSITFVLACCRKYRLPETSRMAHRMAAF